MSPLNSLIRVGLAIKILLLISPPLQAQIIPDSTLGTENSVVNSNQIIKGLPGSLIEGGARRGTSLFHSFQEFNIGEGQAAYFVNPAGVDNILSRVTGENPSHILGKLGILGNANLFFLNPNGIIFGANASLALNGSFLATSASFIELPGGYQFSAKNPQAVPLLTVSIPIGLGLSGQAGDIIVQGTGHNLVATGDPRIPNIPFGNSITRGLSVQPEKTIGLVGGKVNFTGGIVTAPSGRIEIGSLASGEARIILNPSGGFSLAYEGADYFQDIALRQQSLLNASGLTNGNIQIVGKNVDITDASLAFIENQGTNPLGAIKIEASDSLSLTGTTESNPIFAGRIRLTRGLVSQAIGSGKGADIEISTNQLVIQDSGRIYLSTFGSGAGGNLKIEASDSVQILGISSSDPSFGVSSLIATSTAGTGPAGRIELATQHLSIQQGGLLTSTVFSSGTGGNLSIKASESIVLSGYNPNSLIPSIISSSNQGSGQGGNLEIDTKQLILGDGGRVDASTLASGAAGSLTINATDFVKVSGTIPGSINPSLIVSSANRVDPVIQQGLGLPAIPTGASGNVTINTPLLSVTEGAQVTVRNDGTGDGGTLRIHADSIFLDGAGGITASTQSGEGGNITISSRDIRLRNNSEISATAGGTGNGGNIFIDTGTLVLLENSQIAANAFAGRGGNISIFADGVFVSFPDSKITASSQLGIDGNVQINTPETNLQSALEQINTQVISPEEIIAGSCLERRNEKRGSFVYAGMEGLPVTPQSSFSLEEPLTEIQGQPNASDVPEPSKMPPSSELAGGSFSPFSYKWKPGEPILEGGKIVRTREGKTLFVATPEQVAAIAPQGCSVTKTR